MWQNAAVAAEDKRHAESVREIECSDQRSCDCSGVDGVADAQQPVSPRAEIDHGGEAGPQVSQRVVGHWPADREMHVRIDQPPKNGQVTQIDSVNGELGAVRRRGNDLGNLPAATRMTDAAEQRPVCGSRVRPARIAKTARCSGATLGIHATSVAQHANKAPTARLSVSSLET